jgi:hypothetical protein
LSDRQWGTVREDYSSHGTAWDFTHDRARSRAYRWGEDGIAGISDNHQQLCFAIALWNGEDPTLKERLFGLTGNESNRGEDVKEYYFYLDNTGTDARLAQKSILGPICDNMAEPTAIESNSVWVFALYPHKQPQAWDNLQGPKPLMP